ncbi:MAG: caffeoyl-CoA O-methyltransferase [Cyclobacteriaceae bacterium]|jgi:caffeoyl-CoA O-methyltransferase
MDFLPKDIADYAERYTAAPSKGLQQLDRETHLEVLKPRMISGHLQGRLLSMISHMIRPQSILEIGAYTGYSALCLAEGLTASGTLITIERNEELIPRIKQYFADSPFASQLEVRHGNAREVIPQLDNDHWDLVFIDADKESYATYFDLVIDRVTTGGYVLVDNVLWSGKVTQENAKDTKTEALKNFNRKVHEDARVQNLLLPFRDGLMILRKI